MKYLLLLITTVVLFISGDNVESNSPALQANVDNILFKSTFAGADYNQAGEYFIIQGKLNDEILTLRAKYPPANVELELGGDSENFATFERANGIIYTTTIDGGSGSILINEFSTSNKEITGDFNFTAVSVGLDTIRVSGGVFFRVPYGDGIDGEPTAGSFSAEIDGNPFVSINVLANELDNKIVIQGIVNSKKIKLTFPNDVEIGSYDLPASGFSASYTDDGVIEEVITGNFIIISHSVANKTMKGTFSFETATSSILLGQFNVTYQ